MSKDDCKELLKRIFGDDAAEDEDIVSFYMDVNKFAMDELYNQAIDDAVEKITERYELVSPGYLDDITELLQSLKK